MRRVLMVGAVLVLATLASCYWPDTGTRYRFVSINDGKVYRLDRETGAIDYVRGDHLVRVTKKIPVLRVGKYYEMGDAEEDPKFLKYLGDARFQKSKHAVQEESDAL